MAEYDDGYDSRESFERAGADRPEDMEPDDDGELWPMAAHYFSLDASVQYSDAEKLQYIENYKLALFHPFPTAHSVEYQPRQRHGFPGSAYLESDDDYLAANRDLAIWLLDQYGKRSVGTCEAR